MWFARLRESDFQGVVWSSLLILCNLRSPKCDFDEVGKAMIRVVTKPCKVNFFRNSGPKWDIVEVDKCFMYSAGLLPAENVTSERSRKRCFSSSPGLKTHFHYSRRAKCLLDELHKAVFLGVDELRIHFLPFTQTKVQRSKSRKLCINGSTVHPNSFSTSSQAENVISRLGEGEVWRSILRSPNCDMPHELVLQSDVSWCRRPCEFIFYLLHRPKCNLIEVNEAIYKGIDRLPESIFYFLTSQIWYFRDMEEAIFQWVAWVPLLILCLLHCPKCNLGYVGKAMIRVVTKPCKVKLCLIRSSKWDFEEVGVIIHVVSWLCKLILAICRIK